MPKKHKKNLKTQKIPKNPDFFVDKIYLERIIDENVKNYYVSIIKVHCPQIIIIGF